MSPAGAFINSEFDVVDPIVTGFVTSIMLFGALVGSFATGSLKPRLGFRYTALIGCSICLFGGSTPAFSVNLGMFLALRFILGIGVGIIGVICPLYMNEVVNLEKVNDGKKGRYGVVFQLNLTFGILLSYIIGYIYSIKIDGKSLQWRLMLGSFGTLFPLILILVVIFEMKEVQESQQTNETTMLHQQNSGEPLNSKGGWRGLFVLSRIKQTLTGVVLAMTLQLTGVNAIIYFGTNILKSAFPGYDPRLLNVAIGGWNFITTWISAILVGKMSRRLLITGTTLLVSVSLFIVGFCFRYIPDERNRGIGVSVGLFLFIAGFEAGIGCLFYVLCNEIFDKNVRAEGASLVNVLQWMFNLLVSTLFPLMFSSALGESGTFFMFASFGLFCAFYFLKFLTV
jgi:MFS family permease